MKSWLGQSLRRLSGGRAKSDADIADKTNEVGRALGAALRDEGFTRRAGKLRRRLPDDAGVQIVALQGRGSFAVNLGVYFPALARLLERVLREPVLSLDAARPWHGQIHCRLDAALPDARESWWLPAMARGHDLWFTIGRTPEEQREIVEVVARTTREYLVPWLRRNATLEAVVDSPAARAGELSRMAALVALGDRARARALFEPHRYPKRERDAIEAMLTAS